GTGEQDVGGGQRRARPVRIRPSSLVADTSPPRGAPLAATAIYAPTSIESRRRPPAPAEGVSTSMSDIRKLRAVLVALATAVVFSTASCSSSDPQTAAPVGTTSDPTAILGASNKATGTPIKIGLVTDGKSAGIDHTPVVGAFNATVQYVNEHLGGLNGHV